MAIRTITSPGVQINEIDKSGYTPTATGTAVYVKGFTGKGEAYKCMEVTTRAAYEQMFGIPDNEAERYTYAAACEVLNQGGRLYVARLPYDNASFEKMPGIKYTVEIGQEKLHDKAANGCTYASALVEADSQLNDVAIIKGGRSPALYDLSAIDEFRTDEAKVPANSFLIVDTTGALYGKVVEDSRKGMKRECIGIVPVVTTAANALYAQNYIQLTQLSDVNKFEPLDGTKLNTLVATNSAGAVLSIDGYTMETSGLLSSDLTQLIASNAWFSDITSLSVNVLSASPDSIAKVQGVLTSENKFASNAEVEALLPYVANQLSSPETDFSVSSYVEASSTWYTIVSADMQPFTFALSDIAEVSADGSYVVDPSLEASKVLEANGYALDTLASQFGWHGKNGDDTVQSTLGLDAANYFPAIQPAADGDGLDPEHLKDIGVVVYRAYLDIAEGNKVSLELVEAFAGSLYKDDKDPNTGVTKFIDTIVNTNSKYINFFSNCFSSTAAKQYYKDECDILLAPPEVGSVLGLYSPMAKKDISISKSILDGMNKCFDKVSDVNLLDIDIVPDAGVANIASYIKAIFGEKGPYDLQVTDDLGNSLLGMWTCKKATDAHVKMWKTVLLKNDNFCKNIRKDCMFVADGLRPLVLQGQKKIVRDTKPSNSIDKDILPYVPAICGINTSYGAGYADWFEQADDYSGDFFWCPPSIKATGAYINTDVNYDYWLAPAGLTRGRISATDVSFSPNSKQAGAFYEKNWNYAINYPQDGIVLEGQKTFQTKPTALDRVNVRRTMLRLERQVYKVLKYFVYENNTAYTRQRIVDAIDPIMKACWQAGNGGLARYKIICDESNNDANTIDNNELKVSIGVIPNKSAEFILCDFIIGSSGATWAKLF